MLLDPESLGTAFSAYNATVWPAQIALVLLGAAAAGLACGPGGGPTKAAAVLLGSLWFWSGMVYQMGFFGRAHPLALPLGVLAVLQGAGLVFEGLARDELRFGRLEGWQAPAGGVLALYALAAYPLAGAQLRGWSGAASVGLPAPTALLTLGVLLCSETASPLRLWLIPGLWLLAGLAPACRAGLWEDAVLLPALVLAALAVRRRLAERAAA